jgi:hypothetical protein
MTNIAALDIIIRREIDEFARSGWMSHVLDSESWFDEPDGKLTVVRKQNVAAAYDIIRRQVYRNLIERQAHLYRALLLPIHFDIDTLFQGEQDFGAFWTSCSEVASFYRPRRNYQTTHQMPEAGFARIIEIDAVEPEDVDWVATVGCRLGNPCLNEVRLVPGTKKRAVQVFTSLYGSNDDDRKQSNGPILIRATPPVRGIIPIPEGPGFLENFRMLCRAEGCTW